jgi:hypothetical protein
MGQLRVFISYKRSDGTAGDSEALADALEARLKAKAYEVFRDKTVPPGEDWHRAIDRGLDFAHAAVALLSPRALESQWVQYELSVLSFRARQSFVPPVRLLIALLDGVEPKALDQRPYDAMRGGSFEAFVGKKAAGTTLAANEFTDDGHLCDLVEAELAKCAAAHGPHTKMEWLVKDIVCLLRNFDHALDKIEQELRLGAQPDKDARLQAIAEALLRLKLNDFYTIADFLLAERPRHEATADLFERIFPFWVHAQSAAHLASTSERGEVPVIHATELWTLEQFVRRAEVYGGLWHVIDLRLPRGQREDVVVKQFVETAEEKRFGVVSHHRPHDKVVERLERLERRKGASVFFPLVTDVAAAQALSRYRKPWIRPIIVGSPDLAVPPSVPVVPPLVAAREKEALDTHTDINNLARRKQKGRRR